jgi:hypothetical protein
VLGLVRLGVRSINTRMKISELLNTPKKLEDTTSSATTSSAIQGGQTQDIVPQDIVPEQFEGTNEVDSEIESHPDHSAIAEGVSQIFRRQKGGKPTKGFRCTSGPRKGRIVAKPSTCFAKTDPVKSAKIRKKRQQKARIAGKKMAMTKRSGGGSKRLAGVQIKKKSMKGKSVAPKLKARAPVKSRVLKPKKR